VNRDYQYRMDCSNLYDTEAAFADLTAIYAYSSQCLSSADTVHNTRSVSVNTIHTLREWINDQRLTSNLTHNRSFRGKVFSGNRLRWYMYSQPNIKQPKIKKIKKKLEVLVDYFLDHRLIINKILCRQLYTFCRVTWELHQRFQYGNWVCK